MSKPDYVLRAEAIAARAIAERDDKRARMRAEFPASAALVDEFARVFGKPAWISLAEDGRAITAGRRLPFRRNQEHQPTIPGAA